MEPLGLMKATIQYTLSRYLLSNGLEYMTGSIKVDVMGIGAIRSLTII
jgi:hypothetical protein